MGWFTEMFGVLLGIIPALIAGFIGFIGVMFGG